MNFVLLPLESLTCKVGNGNGSEVEKKQNVAMIVLIDIAKISVKFPRHPAFKCI